MKTRHRSNTRGTLINVRMSVDLIAKIDQLRALLQDRSDSTAVVTRSEVLRLALERLHADELDTD